MHKDQITVDVLSHHLLVQLCGHIQVIDYNTTEVIAAASFVRGERCQVHAAYFLDSSRILVSYRNYATCVWDFMDPFVREQHMVAIAETGQDEALAVKFRLCNVRQLWQEVSPIVTENDLKLSISPMANIVAHSKDGNKRCRRSRFFFFTVLVWSVLIRPLLFMVVVCGFILLTADVNYLKR